MKRKKKHGLKMTLDVEGEPVVIGSQKKVLPKFVEWLAENHPMGGFYATIARTNPVSTILYISDIQTVGRENIPISNPDDIRRILADHPEITGVMFIGMKMPRRAVPIGQVNDLLLQKQFSQRGTFKP